MNVEAHTREKNGCEHQSSVTEEKDSSLVLLNSTMEHSHFHESDVVLAVAVQLSASQGEASLEYCLTYYLTPKLLHLCKCAVSLEE